MRRSRTLLVVTGAAVAAALLSGHVIRATAGSGSISALIGRATFEDRLKVRRVDDSGWKVDLKAKPDFDIAVQTIEFPAGSHSGWHGHPGPVFISVVEGTMTFYESDDPDCEPTVLSAGQGYFDVGDHAHIARNESGAKAKNVVVYLHLQGHRCALDQPDPGNCTF